MTFETECSAMGPSLMLVCGCDRYWAAHMKGPGPQAGTTAMTNAWSLMKKGYLW